MFKLIVLSTLLVAAAARPSHHFESHPVFYSTASVVHEPVLAKVGSVVHSVPSAISHQSQSVVHSTAHVVEDIHAPVLKTVAYTHSAPVLHTTYANADVPLYATYDHSYATVPHSETVYSGW